MQIYKVVVGRLEVNCYIVHDETTPGAIIIDPGDEFERIADPLEQKGLIPKYIIFTHSHYDHVCAVGDLKEKYGASVVMHEDEKNAYRATKELCLSWGFGKEDFPDPDMTVKDGDRIILGKLLFEVIHTPGHTPGSICLYGDNTLFTGDTLFRRSVGRTDLPGGSTEDLLRSLRRLVVLPPDTRVLCGHGDETTIGEEIRNNPFLNGGRLRLFP